MNIRQNIPASCAAVLISAALLQGCAYQRPAEVTAQMARTESSLQQAEQSGAMESALSDLQSAKDKFAEAQRALEKENREGDRTALHLAQQAEVDAQYAAAKAQTLRQEAAAREVEDGVETLRREATRDDRAGSIR